MSRPDTIPRPDTQLRSDPRFEAYVENQMAIARDGMPPGESAGHAALPFVLVGIAGISIMETLLNGGGAWASGASLGTAGLVALASLCWLLD